MKKNDSRYIIVSCKKDTQLFLCLMRHIINTITLFGKFHILQVYRTRFFCVLPNSVTHLSTCLHMHTFDTVHNGHYTLFSFFLFLFVSLYAMTLTISGMIDHDVHIRNVSGSIVLHI